MPRSLPRSDDPATEAVGPEAAPVHQPAPAEQTAPAPHVARMLALQRGAGNMAVSNALARRQHVADQAPRAGGWNAGTTAVGGAHRFPVKGITGMGNQRKDTEGETDESSVGRAIVVVPDQADLSAPFEVLLLFHGQGIANRERTQAGGSGPAGTVRDVESDMVPQQLAHSGRNTIGVMPQGLRYSTGDKRSKALGGAAQSGRFGITDPDAYVANVLKLAAPDIKSAMPAKKVPDTPVPRRVISAGHSAGGADAISAASTMTKKRGAPKSIDAWIASPRLFLFDGMHSAGQVANVMAVLKAWIKEDVAILASAPDPAAALAKRGLKFRSTFSDGSWGGYPGWNRGGSWTEEVLDKDKKKVKVVRSVSKANSLKGQIDALINASKRAFGTHLEKVREQYAVDGTKGGHEYTLGMSGAEEPRRIARRPDRRGRIRQDAGLQRRREHGEGPRQVVRRRQAAHSGWRRAADARTADARAANTRAADTGAPETGAADARTADARATAARTAHTRATEARAAAQDHGRAARARAAGIAARLEEGQGRQGARGCHRPGVDQRRRARQAQDQAVQGGACDGGRAGQGLPTAQG